jgi:hypothetical protein
MNRFLPIALTVVILAGLAELTALMAIRKLHQHHMPPESKSLLETADEFTFYSLNPGVEFGHQGTNTFRGHVILSQIKIDAGPKRNALVEALAKAITKGGPAYLCFNPRHGIHARKGTETLDCLICFECGQAYVGTNWYAISDGPKALFNQTVKDAAIPLPTN